MENNQLFYRPISADGEEKVGGVGTERRFRSDGDGVPSASAGAPFSFVRRRRSFTDPRPASSRARTKTRANMVRSSRPVLVLRSEGW